MYNTWIRFLFYIIQMNSCLAVYLSEVWSPDVGHQVLRLINPHGARSQKLFKCQVSPGSAPLHWQCHTIIPLYPTQDDLHSEIFGRLKHIFFCTTIHWSRVGVCLLLSANCKIIVPIVIFCKDGSSESPLPSLVFIAVINI